MEGSLWSMVFPTAGSLLALVTEPNIISLMLNESNWMNVLGPKIKVPLFHHRVNLGCPFISAVYNLYSS